MASFSGKVSSEKEGSTVSSRYGGIVPKKKPLIAKDHGRAFFDSADWALCQQTSAHKPEAAVESLQPKLERTPHQQLPPRSPKCTSSRNDSNE